MCGCNGGSTSSGTGGTASAGGLQYVVVSNGYRVAYSDYAQALRHQQSAHRRGETAVIKKSIPGAKKR